MVTFRHVLRRLEVPRDLGSTGTAYMSHDTRPLPPSRRSYGPMSFVGLWMITGSFNIGGWTTGSTLLALGLNVWQAMLTVIIGNCLLALVCIGTGAAGATWHIGFPILSRSSWGMLGAIFPLVNRILLSFVWYSTQVWYGGQCTKTLIAAIWPSFLNLNAPLAGGTMDTGDFVAFILFFLACLPVISVPPEYYHRPFMVASIMVVPTVFGFLGWAVATAHGGGALLQNATVVVGVAPARGPNLGWMLMYGISCNLGSVCTHIFNQSDFTRFAKKPGDQIAAQAVMVPMGTIIVSLIGIICTSCGATLYPDEGLLWQPYALMAEAQKHSGNAPSARAPIAFASIAFMVAQLGIGVAENAVCGGIDLAGLFPRYFTLRRGAYLTAVLALVFQPWVLLNGATVFLTVIGGYAIFLGPMTGIMLCDYLVIRHQKLALTHLYDQSPASTYWYQKGVNWRACVAWVMGVWPLMPGFIASVQKRDAGGWTKLYYCAYLTGMAISAFLYYVFNTISPIPGIGLVDEFDVFGTFTEQLSEPSEDGSSDIEKPNSDIAKDKGVGTFVTVV